MAREGQIIGETEAGDVGHHIIRAFRAETAETGTFQQFEQNVAAQCIVALAR